MLAARRSWPLTRTARERNRLGKLFVAGFDAASPLSAVWSFPFHALRRLLQADYRRLGAAAGHGR